MILEEAAAEAPEVWDQQLTGNTTEWERRRFAKREGWFLREPKAASRVSASPVLRRAAEAGLEPFRVLGGRK